MGPDTHLGENARHREVSDDQATPYRIGWRCPWFQGRSIARGKVESCSVLQVSCNFNLVVQRLMNWAQLRDLQETQTLLNRHVTLDH